MKQHDLFGSQDEPARPAKPKRRAAAVAPAQDPEPAAPAKPAGASKPDGASKPVSAPKPASAPKPVAIGDAEARRRAVTEFDRPLMLAAGAGTGKTATLVVRVAHWCLGPGWELEADS